MLKQHSIDIPWTFHSEFDALFSKFLCPDCTSNYSSKLTITDNQATITCKNHSIKTNDSFTTLNASDIINSDYLSQCLACSGKLQTPKLTNEDLRSDWIDKWDTVYYQTQSWNSQLYESTIKINAIPEETRVQLDNALKYNTEINKLLYDIMNRTIKSNHFPTSDVNAIKSLVAIINIPNQLEISSWLSQKTNLINANTPFPWSQWLNIVKYFKSTFWIKRYPSENTQIIFTHSNTVNAFAFIPPHKFASGSSDKKIFIWDSNTFYQVASLYGHTRPVYSLCLIRDLLASGDDRGEIKIWDITNYTCLKSFINPLGNIIFNLLEVNNEINYVSDLLSATSSSITIYDMTEYESKTVWGIKYSPEAIMQFSPDKLFIGTTNNKLLSLNLYTCEYDDKSEIQIPNANAIRLARYSKNKILIGLNNNKIMIFNVTKNEIAGMFDVFNWYNLVWLDNKKMMTGSHDGLVRIWNLKEMRGNCEKVLVGHGFRTNCFGKLNNGQIVSGDQII